MVHLMQAGLLRAVLLYVLAARAARERWTRALTNGVPAVAVPRGLPDQRNLHLSRVWIVAWILALCLALLSS